MPTPELRQLLLKELSIHHDLKRLCLEWDLDTVDSYGLLSSSSQKPVAEANVNTYTQPDGYNQQRSRRNHQISTFG